MEKDVTKKKTQGGTGRPVVDADRRSRLGQIIRKYRMAAGMDQATLAAKLGYTKGAVGNWELGHTRPDVDSGPKLCKELNIPVTELLGIDQETALPIDDKNVLDMYHSLDRYNRHTIRQIMERLLFQQDSQEKERLRFSYGQMCLYEEAAAAGISTPMQDDVENSMVYVLKRDIPHGANGIMHVNGRSMEPEFPDGSLVYIDSNATVVYGQVGIFIVNNEAFIKEYQPDGLRSYNHSFPTIKVEGDAVVRCCGRVLGIVGNDAIATGSLLEKVEAAFDEVNGN